MDPPGEGFKSVDLKLERVSGPGETTFDQFCYISESRRPGFALGNFSGRLRGL